MNNKIVLAVSAALLSAVMSPSILAAEATTESSAVITVPAGDLDSALKMLARQTGLQLLYDRKSVEGIRTKGVSGARTAEEAIGELLEGTKLTMKVDASGALLISQVREGGQGQLRLAQSGDTASSSELRQDDQSMEEITITSTRMLISVGKTPTTVRETPQSVSIITRERIESQNMSSLEDVMLMAPGVTSVTSSIGQKDFYSRGYALTTVQLDGVPTQYSPWNILAPDLAVYDRVEVLRGADGLYSGAGKPSGTVNLVRKKPLSRFQTAGSAQAGSDDQYRVEADVTGPLVESGKLRGRLVGAYDDREFFYKLSNRRSLLLYGAIAYDFTPGTVLTAGVQYHDADALPFVGGVPRYGSDGTELDLPRSTMLGSSWNSQGYRGITTHVELQQALRGDWFARVTATRVDARMDYKYGYATGGSGPGGSIGPDGLSSYYGYLAKYDDVQTGLELLLSGSMTLLGRKHDLQVGANWQQHDFIWDDRLLEMVTDSIAIHNWDASSVPEPSQYLGIWYSKNRQYQNGVFGRARFRLSDRVSLIGGGRISSYESRYRDTPGEVKQSGQFTPYAAAVIDVGDAWSAYASFTRIFEPQSTTRTFSGDPFPPRFGTNREIGLKGELFGGDLNVSLAAFRIEETNRPQVDLLHPPVGGLSYFVPSGEVRSEGFDVEANGSLTRQWQVFFGYTFNTTEYVRDDSLQGQGFSTHTPKHLAKLWTTFRPQWMSGRLTMGAGVSAQSRQYNRLQSFPLDEIEQGRYALLSAQVGYRVNDRTGLAINFDNLLDKRYWQTVGSPGYGNFYGTPRTVALTVRAKY